MTWLTIVSQLLDHLCHDITFVPILMEMIKQISHYKQVFLAISNS
jgi:hypothetical protein